MPDDTPNDDRKRSLAAKLLRPKVAVPLTILFLLLSSPVLFRGWFLRGVPDPLEPFDAKPLLEDSLSEDQNAFTEYGTAIGLYVKPSRELRADRDAILDHGWQLANDDVRQFLDDNKAALSVWKQGTEKDQALYLSADAYDFATNLEPLYQLRDLQRTVLLLCRRLEAEDNPQEAWQWYRAAIRFSRHMGLNGIIVERLSARASFLLTVESLVKWAAHPKLTSDDLKLAMTQLQQDWKLTEKPSTTYQLEYLSLSRMFDDYQDNIAESSKMQPAIWSGFFFSIAEPELSQRIMRFYFYNHLQFCDLPRYQRPKRTARPISVYDDPAGFEIEEFEWSEEGFHTASLRAMLFVYMKPVDQIPDLLDDEEVRYRALIVTLAGQAFRRDHERFPDTLDDLVPDYLDAIPMDNYNGQPLKYRFDPAGPVVYSVNQNLRDDGGYKWSSPHGLTVTYDLQDLGLQMQLPESELQPKAESSP